MSRRNLLLALVGLLVGVGSALFWLSPRLQAQQLPDELLSASRPLTVPFTRPLRPNDLSQWLELTPTTEGSWQAQGKALVFTPAIPLIYGQSYTLIMRAGMPGASGLPLWRSFSWTFTVAQPPLLFLQADNAGRLNVWQLRLDGDEPRLRLTDEPLGVWDYHAAAGSSSLLVVSEDDDGSLDLVAYDWQTSERRLLLDCAGLCENARWQPWGELVVYELRPRAGGSAEVWLLNTTTGDTWLVQPTEIFAQLGLTVPTGQFPRWSADGRYVAYFASEAQLIVILDVGGGAEAAHDPIFIPATLDTMGQWSPVAPLLAYTEYARGLSQPHSHTLPDGTIINHDGAELYSHTVIANLVREEAVDVVQGMEFNDGLAAWHPNGQLLAVPRSLYGEGAQIWLMDQDGGNGRMVTTDPGMSHSSLVWCPCGRELAYQRSPIGGAAAPTIWLYDSQTESHRVVIENAFLPGWLP